MSKSPMEYEPEGTMKYEPIKSPGYPIYSGCKWDRGVASDMTTFMKQVLPVLLADDAPQKKATVKKPRRPRKQAELPTKFISLLPHEATETTEKGDLT